jgi:hypothetical protein
LSRVNRFFYATDLVGDLKARVIAGKRFPLQIDMFNCGTGRSLVAPLEDFVNPCFLAFEYGFDRAVGFIPDPTGYLASGSGSLGFHPEKYTLNSTTNDDVGSNLVFHFSASFRLIGICLWEMTLILCCLYKLQKPARGLIRQRALTDENQKLFESRA